MARVVPSDVRYVYSPNFGPIGSKRNKGCELARGDAIAFFDDDDFSSPGRVADQVARMEATGKPVTGYHTLRFTDGRRWWQYYLRDEYALGTTLMFRKDFWQTHRFPDIQIGEDTDFTDRVFEDMATADAGDFMFATIHEGNASPRNLAKAQWTEL